jgi:threonine dehydratase
VDDLDAIIIPVGSAGMISGVAIAAKSLRPGIRIIGVEPAAADDAARSFKTGYHIQVAEAPKTIADGLRAPMGTLGWTVASLLVDAILTVSEDEIAHATKLIWSRLKVVVEPSASVGVAAAMTAEFKAMGFKRVAIVLSGGNVDVDDLPW